jgi:hypothetical protein
MRYMMMIKATPDYEAGRPPNPALIASMGALAEEMARTGVLESTGGLLPSVAGARLTYAAGKRSLVDGPFAETKELIGGYAIINARSREHAVELADRVLDVHVAAGVPNFEMEIRPMFDGSCSKG